MKNNQENPSLSGIDKYSGSFDKDELGVTQIPTATIRTLKDFTLLAVFTFLASCPHDWKINAKHLAIHFNCNKDTIYAAIDKLIELGFLVRTIIRDKGKFARYHYRLHLRQIVHAEPCPEKPDTVTPDTVKPDTYKTDILPLQNKEKIKTTTTVKNPSSNSFFSLKIKNDLLALKLESDTRSFEEFLIECEIHINSQNTDFAKYQRISGLKNILKGLKETGEHFKAKRLHLVKKQETHEETMKRNMELNRLAREERERR